MFPWPLPYFSSGMYSPITFFMLWHLWHFFMTFSHIKEPPTFPIFHGFITILVNFPLDYLANKPLYISIITTQPSPTHPSPPSEMRGKVWTVKRVFISTNCSYFSNLPSPTPFFKNLFSYCKYCLLTLVSFFITRGLQNNLNNCIE